MYLGFYTLHPAPQHRRPDTPKPPSSAPNPKRRKALPLQEIGVRIRGTLGHPDPLNKVPFKKAISRIKKGPL